MKSSKIAEFLVLILLLFSMNLIKVIPVMASFDTSQAEYYEEVKSAFSLTPEQEQMLEKYGFVVVELSSSNQSEPEGGFYPELRLRKEKRSKLCYASQVAL